MFAQNFLLPALAVIGSVAAQTTPTVCTTTATVHSQADATALAGCSTVKGDIVIAPDAAGVIALNGIQQVTGSVSCINAGGLTSLSSDQIGSIGGTFTLTNLTLLSTLQFNSLTSVNTISWTALPDLSELTFPGTVSSANSVTISNTFLSTLDGINLNTVATLQIDNNNRLQTFSTQVANITQGVVIDANGKGLNVSFPNLIWAANMSFRDVASLSVPSLAVVNGSFGLYETVAPSLMAPNLTSVGSMASNTGSFSVVSDTMLTNISVPLLKSIGGALQVGDNGALEGVGFPVLSYVGGAVNVTGNLTTPSFPDITNVRGTFNVASTQVIDCTSYNSIKGNIQGKFTCKTGTSASGTSGSGSGTATGTSATSSSTDKSAATTFTFSMAAAGLSVLGGMAQLLL